MLQPYKFAKYQLGCPTTLHNIKNIQDNKSWRHLLMLSMYLHKHNVYNYFYKVLPIWASNNLTC